MFVCLCKNITDTQIRQSIADGAASLHDVRKELGVATQCCKCLPDARAVVNDALEQQALQNHTTNPLTALSSALFFPAELSR
ncbi:bacterioferritin-associated ferredoxin [Eionea flava]